MPVTILLKAMGYSTEGILHYFYDVERVFVEKGRLYLEMDDYLVGQKVPEDIVAPKSGEVLAKKGRKLTKPLIRRIIESGIKWIVSDEAILFKSLKIKKRDTKLLYQPHLLKRKEGELNIVFRDRNLSDLIGFVYHKMKEVDAVNDFLAHLENINKAFKGKDILVTIALDGENAWEFYRNDGHDFLELFYQRISDCDFIKTTTISEYLKLNPAKLSLTELRERELEFAGSFDTGSSPLNLENLSRREFFGVTGKKIAQTLIRLRF